MSLADEARGEMPSRGMPCTVAALKQNHPEVEDELDEALDDRTLMGSAIARALRARYGDEGPSDNTLNRHRTGRCACG